LFTSQLLRNQTVVRMKGSVAVPYPSKACISGQYENKQGEKVRDGASLDTQNPSIQTIFAIHHQGYCHKGFKNLD